MLLRSGGRSEQMTVLGRYDDRDWRPAGVLTPRASRKNRPKGGPGQGRDTEPEASVSGGQTLFVAPRLVRGQLGRRGVHCVRDDVRVSRWLAIFVLLSAVGVVVFGPVSGQDVRVAVAAAGEPASIVFVDVDQGDGVVMRIGGQVIVSDVGEHRVADVNAALERLGAERIDVVILSHPHDDHVKNSLALFARWEVSEVVLSRSEYWQGTKTNRAVIAAIKKEGCSRRSCRPVRRAAGVARSGRS